MNLREGVILVCLGLGSFLVTLAFGLVLNYQSPTERVIEQFGGMQPPPAAGERSASP